MVENFIPKRREWKHIQLQGESMDENYGEEKDLRPLELTPDMIRRLAGEI